MDSMGHRLVSLPRCPLSRIRSCPGPLAALSSSLFPSSILPLWALLCSFLPAALSLVPSLPGCEKWVDSAPAQLVTVSAPGSRGWSGLVSTWLAPRHIQSPLIHAPWPGSLSFSPSLPNPRQLGLNSSSWSSWSLWNLVLSFWKKCAY